MMTPRGREANPRSAVRSRIREGVDEIAIGVLSQTRHGHGPARGIPDQALQLVTPMSWDLGIGVQGKALHAGTAGIGERGRLAVHAKRRTALLSLPRRGYVTIDATS